MKRLHTTISMLMTAALFACSGGTDVPDSSTSGLCGDESRADEFVVGIEKSTAQSSFKVRIADVRVNDVPGVPDRGDNVWTFEVMDASGTALDGAAVEVKPWMPDHRHGTNPLYIDARPMTEAGRYEIGTFDLFMGGFWQFTFTVESAGQSDVATFGFCVEG